MVVAVEERAVIRLYVITLDSDVETVTPALCDRHALHAQVDLIRATGVVGHVYHIAARVVLEKAAVQHNVPQGNVCDSDSDVEHRRGVGSDTHQVQVRDSRVGRAEPLSEITRADERGTGQEGQGVVLIQARREHNRTILGIDSVLNSSSVSRDLHACRGISLCKARQQVWVRHLYASLARYADTVAVGLAEPKPLK